MCTMFPSRRPSLLLTRVFLSIEHDRRALRGCQANPGFSNRRGRVHDRCSAGVRGQRASQIDAHPIRHIDPRGRRRPRHPRQSSSQSRDAGDDARARRAPEPARRRCRRSRPGADRVGRNRVLRRLRHQRIPQSRGCGRAEKTRARERGLQPGRRISQADHCRAQRHRLRGRARACGVLRPHRGRGGRQHRAARDQARRVPRQRRHHPRHPPHRRRPRQAADVLRRAGAGRDRARVGPRQPRGAAGRGGRDRAHDGTRARRRPERGAAIVQAIDRHGVRSARARGGRGNLGAERPRLPDGGLRRGRTRVLRQATAALPAPVRMPTCPGEPSRKLASPPLEKGRSTAKRSGGDRYPLPVRAYARTDLPLSGGGEATVSRQLPNAREEALGALNNSGHMTRAGSQPICDRPRPSRIVRPQSAPGARMLDLLQGIRVVSFNHFLFGPMGIQALADLGADVIAIETPEGAWQRHWSSGDIWHDGQGMLHLCTNRNKRSIALDLKSSRGKDIALKLVDGADVVAENFRPGVMDKLGFGYTALQKRKPALIYASASGYGPDGPYAERPGQDLLAQALFGLMAITGEKPADVYARRHVAGWYYAAPYGVYATANGYLALSLCPLPVLGEAIGEPRLASFSEQDSWKRQDEIGELIAAALGKQPTQTWVPLLERAKIWHAPVQTYAELVEDPQVEHMQALVTLPGGGKTGAPVTLVNHPVRYDGEAAEIRLPPQRLGAQTREILAELGLAPAEIDALARDGVVRLDGT